MEQLNQLQHLDESVHDFFWARKSVIIAPAGFLAGRPAAQQVAARRLRQFRPDIPWLEVGAGCSLAAGLLHVNAGKTGGLVILGNPSEFEDPLLAEILLSGGCPEFPLEPPRSMVLPDPRSRAPVLPGTGGSRDRGFAFAGVTRDFRRLPLLVIGGSSSIGLLAAVICVTTDLLTHVTLPPAFSDNALAAVVRPKLDLTSELDDFPPHAIELISMWSRASIPGVASCYQSGGFLYNQAADAWAPELNNTVELFSDSNGKRKEILLNGKAVGQIDGDRASLLWVLAVRSANGEWTSLQEACNLIDGDLARNATLNARLKEIARMGAPDPALMDRVKEFGYKCLNEIGKMGVSDLVEKMFDPKRQTHLYRLKAAIIFR